MTSIKDPIKKLRELEGQLEGYGNGMYAPRYPELEGIADEIEAQYMRLPVDANGTPIRPGDEVMLGDSAIEITGVSGETVTIGQPYLARECRIIEHYTVEELLEKFVEAYDEWDENAVDDRHGKCKELFASYAERIRKAVQNED